MGTYEFTVFATRDLYDYVGTSAQDRVRDYVESAFDNHISGHDADVTIYTPSRSGYPNPPTEATYDSQNAQDVCGQNNSSSWLVYWFEKWASCNPPSSYIASDVNILLTDSSNESGATIHADGTGWCTAETQDIASNPTSFTRYSTTYVHDVMQTAFHEMGHALLDPDNNYPNDGHETGAVTKWEDDDSGHYVTPLGINGKDCNLCSTCFYRPGTRYWDLVWSECGQNAFWSDPGEN